MTLKMGLNRKEQIQAAKWMKEGVPADAIAKKFSTTTAIVKQFTQENLDKATAKAKARLSALTKAEQARRQKAAVLKEAIELKDETDFS